MLQVNTQEYEYGGFITFDYHIIKPVFTATNPYNLRDALNDKNYSGYILSADIGLSSSTQNTTYFTLDEDQTFVNNGYTLTLGNNVVFTNNGTITLTQNQEDNTKLSIDLINNGSLINNGVIDNGGIIYLSTPSETFTLGDNASVTGAGSIYAYSDIDSTNNVYIRQYIPELKENGDITLSATKYTYDGTHKKPTVNLANSDGHISVTYSNNVNAGAATVLVKANSLDTLFAGSTTLDFTITRGTKHIYSTGSSSYYLCTSGNVFEDEGYDTYVMHCDLIISKKQIPGSYLYEYGYGVLPSGTTLVLGDYGIYFGNQHPNMYVDYYSSDKTVGEEYGLKICAGAKVEVNISSAADFTKYMYFADKLTLTGNVSEVIDFNNSKSYTSPSSFNSNADDFRRFTIREDGFVSFTLDLNGYTLEKGISFINNKDTTFNAYIVDSSGTKTGTISHGTTNAEYYSINGRDSWNGKSMMIINVDGVKHIGRTSVSTGNGNLKFFATDCSFTASSSELRALYIGAYTELDNCTISGPTAIYISSKDETFINNCTITSTAAYSDTGVNNGVGSGIVQDTRSSLDDLTVTNCSITCNGYAIEILKLSASTVTDSTLLGHVNASNNTRNALQGTYLNGLVQVITKSSKY